MLKPGDAIDRYTIEGSLGEGGMGQVYRAHDPRLQRRVALKVLHATEGEPASASGRLLREARAAAALDHPNVVSVFDVGEVDGVPYIAMELIEGKSLRHFVGDATVPVDRRLRWLLDAARALAAAHRRGLVHRDVKPENVMAREDGVVKVLDFGIARRAQAPIDPRAPTQVPEGGASTFTREGALVGTPLYMAPEQLRGDTIDGRTDQFAWGVMAYELLSGRHPWDISDALRLAAQITADDPKPLHERAPWVSQNVSGAITRAMKKKPGERFATMDDLLAAIEGEEKRSISDPTMVPLATTTKAVLSPQPPLSTTGGTVAPAMTGPAGTLPTGAAPSAVVETTLPAAARTKRTRGIFAALVAVALFCGGFFLVRRLSHSGTTVPPPTTDATSATSAFVTVTDLPVPQSTNAAAIDDYKAGVQAYRDGKWRETVRLFSRAQKTDPSLAAAQLRGAWTTLLYGEANEPGVTLLDLARNHRAALGPRDRAMLDAIAPLYLAPPAPKTSEPLVRAAIAASPNDAELHFLLGYVLGEVGDWSNAEAALDEALRRDPSFGAALNWKGMILQRQGKHAAAIAAWDRCVASSSNATACLRGRENVFEIDGQCARADGDLRMLLSLEENEPTWRRRLAKVLYALGKPREAVELALKQAETPDARSPYTKYAQIQLEELYGDFEKAEASLRTIDELLATSNDDSQHGSLMSMVAFLAEETARPDVGAAAADTYLKYHSVWTPSADHLTYEPIAWNALRSAGKLAPDALAKKRADWLAADDAAFKAGGLPKEHPFYAWIVGWAFTAQTPEEAKAAIAAMPTPVPPIWDLDWSLSQGRTLLRAGRTDEAIDVLRRLTRTCRALDGAIEHTRAHDLLGQALELNKDTAGACVAYQVVSKRWGTAKPRSITADHARARIAALHCAP